MDRGPYIAPLRETKVENTQPSAELKQCASLREVHIRNGKQRGVLERFMCAATAIYCMII